MGGFFACGDSDLEQKRGKEVAQRASILNSLSIFVPRFTDLGTKRPRR